MGCMTQECWGMANGKGNVNNMSGCVNKNHGECRTSSSLIGCEVLRDLWVAGFTQFHPPDDCCKGILP